MDETGKQAPEDAKDFTASTGDEDHRHFDRIFQENTELPGLEVSELLDRLNTPAVEVKYGESGSVDVATDSYEYSFSYQPVAEELMRRVEEYVGSLQFKDWRNEGVAPDRESLLPESWKQLTSLKFRTADGQNEFNIADIAPEHAGIFFYPSSKNHNAAMLSESLVLKSKSIHILGGDLAAPISILLLLHEVGHLWDSVNVKSGKAKPVEQGEHSDLKETLRKERMANVFALKVVRLFTKPGDPFREDALKYLKHYALGSYHWGIKEDIKDRAIMAKIGREMGKDYDIEGDQREEEERAIYDEFLKWHETEEYRSWKMQDEYKDLEDWEEYGLWREWCEKNGTAWWKVLPADVD